MARGVVSPDGLPGIPPLNRGRNLRGGRSVSRRPLKYPSRNMFKKLRFLFAPGFFGVRRYVRKYVRVSTCVTKNARKHPSRVHERRSSPRNDGRNFNATNLAAKRNIMESATRKRILTGTYYTRTREKERER